MSLSYRVFKQDTTCLNMSEGTSQVHKLGVGLPNNQELNC